MDKKYIEENEIEIKYLRNQLEGEELEGFEVYLMENPEAVEWLSINGLFLKEVPTTPNIVVKRGLFSGFKLFESEFWSHATALSVGMILAIAIMFTFKDRDLMIENASFSDIVYLSETRSFNESPTKVAVSQRPGKEKVEKLIILVLEAGLQPGSIVRVRSFIADSNDRVSQKNLEVTEQGEILSALSVSAIRGSVERYQIEVRSNNLKQEILKTFLIEIAAQ